MRIQAFFSAAALAVFSIPCAAVADSGPAARVEARVERVIYICATTSLTRRAFEQQYGTAPVFITAEDALAAAGADERWTAPRCMTEAQHARLDRMRRQAASRR